jgi:hypothetical protein
LHCTLRGAGSSSQLAAWRISEIKPGWSIAWPELQRLERSFASEAENGHAGALPASLQLTPQLEAQLQRTLDKCMQLEQAMVHQAAPGAASNPDGAPRHVNMAKLQKEYGTLQPLASGWTQLQALRQEVRLYLGKGGTPAAV